MALAQNRELKHFASQELVDLPVADNVRIFKGALVGLDASTGYARPLIAGDQFVGVAYAEANNKLDGHIPGGIRVRLHQNIDMVHALTGIGQVNVGDTVYASDDGTLTLTATGNSLIGEIVNIEGAHLARVRCAPWAA